MKSNRRIVYLAFVGSYDSRECVGACSSRKLANEASRLGGMDRPDVERHVIDKALPCHPAGMYLYHVWARVRRNKPVEFNAYVADAFKDGFRVVLPVIERSLYVWARNADAAKRQALPSLRADLESNPPTFNEDDESSTSESSTSTDSNQ